VQNDVGNRYSTTTVIVPLTDAAHIKKPSPIYIFVKKGDGGATKDSYVLCDQIRTVDHKRLLKSLGILAPETIAAVDNAMLISLALPGVSIPNR
jgi:mRNA interferase MazF